MCPSSSSAKSACGRVLIRVFVVLKDKNNYCTVTPSAFIVSLHMKAVYLKKMYAKVHKYVIVNKTKVLLSHAFVTLSDFVYTV